MTKYYYQKFKLFKNISLYPEYSGSRAISKNSSKRKFVSKHSPPPPEYPGGSHVYLLRLGLPGFHQSSVTCLVHSLTTLTVSGVDYKS